MAIIDVLLHKLLSRPESYRQIGQSIGIDHAMLVRFVNGQKMLSLPAAERLAKFLDLGLKSTKRSSRSN